MNIQSTPAIFWCHNTALGMPARTSLAPWGIPVRLSHLLGLPKHEVCGAFLLLFSGDFQFAKTGTEIFHILMRQLSIGRKGSGVIVHRTVHRISKALLYQHINKIHHSLNFFRGLGMGGSLHNIQIRHVLFHFGNIALGNGRAICTFVHGSLNNLVVHIRVVGDIANLIALIFHKTTEGVEYNHRTGISDMN